jgi:uncharacterized membrane protein
MKGLLRYWTHVPAPLRRIAVLLAGFVLLLAGLAMLVLPGPGIAVIVLAVVVLATEFVWAHHLLRRGVELVPTRWRPAVERKLPAPKSADVEQVNTASIR